MQRLIPELPLYILEIALVKYLLSFASIYIFRYRQFGLIRKCKFGNKNKVLWYTGALKTFRIANWSFLYLSFPSYSPLSRSDISNYRVEEQKKKKGYNLLGHPSIS